jgi:hypothetical protein
MKIEIHNNLYEFDVLTLRDKWRKQNTDSFAFPVRIGRTDCFVKRFYNVLDSDPLLLALKGNELQNIPSIYDAQIVESPIGNYLLLIQRYVEGVLLDDTLRTGNFDRKSIDLKRIANDMANALYELHSRGFWHTDICFKNIQKCYSDFYLIDIDSCLPIETKYSSDNVINKDFHGILSYYFNTFYHKVFMKSGITGVQYNWLQIAAMLVYMQFLKEKTLETYNVKNIPKVIEFLQYRKQEVHDILCEGLIRNLERKDLLTLAEILPKQNDRPFVPQKKEEPPKPIKPPIINSFDVSPVECFKGDNILLTWNVANYTNLRLKELPNLKIDEASSIRIKNVTANKSFTLLAENTGIGGTKITTASVRVKVKEREPLIKSFTASSNQCNFGDAVTLNWVVENATKVSIYDGDMKLTGGNFGLNGSAKVTNFRENTTFTLVVENTANGKQITKKQALIVTLNKASIPAPKFTTIEVDGFSTTLLTVKKGQPVRLSWVVKDATEVYVNGVSYGKTLSGSINFSIDSDHTIQVAAVNNLCGVTQRTEAPKIRIQVRKEETHPPPPSKKPEIISFTINGLSNDYISTFDSKLTFQVEAQNTDKLEFTVNGSVIKINNLKINNGRLNGKFDIPFQVGRYDIVLKAYGLGQIPQIWNKIIEVKELKVEPPKITEFRINDTDALNAITIPMKRNNGVVKITASAANTDILNLYINGAKTKSLNANGSIKGQFEIDGNLKAGNYIVKVEARRNGRDDAKECMLTLMPSRIRVWIKTFFKLLGIIILLCTALMIMLLIIGVLS